MSCSVGPCSVLVRLRKVRPLRGYLPPLHAHSCHELNYLAAPNAPYGAMLLKRSIAATIQIQNPRGKRSAYHNRNRKSKGGRFMSPSSLLLYYHHQQEVAGPIIMSRSHFQSSFRCPLRMFLHALLLITTLHKSVYAQLEIHLPIKYKVDQVRL